MSRWDAHRLVFMDESASNERIGDRKWGWAPLGVPPEVKRWLGKGERYSILPAYVLDGWLEPLVVQGAITAVIFEWWLEFKILPLCNRWPGDRDILIMDNCSIHKSERVRDMCDRKGVQLEYLPPYSPRFNPIEASFHDFKAHVRRHFRVYTQADYLGFEDFLVWAVQQIGIGPDAAKRACGHFRHAGYQGVPDN